LLISDLSGVLTLCLALPDHEDSGGHSDQFPPSI